MPRESLQQQRNRVTGSLNSPSDPTLIMASSSAVFPLSCIGQTGESMWENDLLAQAQALRDDEQGRERASPQLEQWLKQQADRVRLVAYLGRHDPVRLVQVRLARRTVGRRRRTTSFICCAPSVHRVFSGERFAISAISHWNYSADSRSPCPSLGTCDGRQSFSGPDAVLRQCDGSW